MIPIIGAKLQEWRRAVSRCRKCRLLADGREINPSDPNQSCHAQIHYQVTSDQGYKSGWATAMLDKSPDPDYSQELLEVSCRSGIMAILEAPNRDDTYRLSKGYLTYDTNTDETGKRARRLLEKIGVSPEEVIFTNTVQCMPADRGKGPKIRSKQRNNCRDHLRHLLAIVKPKVVLAFGNEALRELHRFEPIVIEERRLRFDEVKVGLLAGHRIQQWASTCLVPLYHPGPIVVANATRKDGAPGTGRSEIDQLRDIKEALCILR